LITFFKKGYIGLFVVIFLIFIGNCSYINILAQSHVSKPANHFDSIVKHQLQPMDIILMKGKSRISRSIEFITQSQYSHVAIVFDPEKNLTIEATLNGVVNGDLNKYKGCSSVFRLKTITKEQSEKIVKFTEQQLGKPYDYEELIGLLLRYGFHISINDFEKGRYTCSTFVNSAYASVGIRLTNQIIPSPEDIFESPLLIKVADI
jgi:uncharacterized protein YycO